MLLDVWRTVRVVVVTVLVLEVLVAVEVSVATSLVSLEWVSLVRVPLRLCEVVGVVEPVLVVAPPSLLFDGIVGIRARERWFRKVGWLIVDGIDLPFLYLWLTQRTLLIIVSFFTTKSTDGNLCRFDGAFLFLHLQLEGLHLCS